MPRTLNGMGRKKKAEETVSLRLPQSMVKRIRRIAVHRGQDPGDYVAERFGALLDADEKKMVKEIEAERQEDAS